MTHDNGIIRFQAEERREGGFISGQNLGYLTKEKTPGTRASVNCWSPVYEKIVYIVREGDGNLSIATDDIITGYDWNWKCEEPVITAPYPESSGSGEVYIPPQPDYSGVIPPGERPRPEIDWEGGGSGGGSSGNSGSDSGSGERRDDTLGNTGNIPYADAILDENGIDILPDPGKNQQQDPYTAARKRFAEEKDKLLAEVKKYTQIPNGTGINLVEYCTSTARAKDGNIEVCYKFYTNEYLTDKDRVSILYHEVFHIKNHDTFKEIEPYEMKTAIILQNVPAEFKKFIIDYNIGKEYLPLNQWEQEYLRVISFQDILPPEYYRNEIETYENEIRTITDVSDYYDTERRYMLWRVKQLYDISKNYYGK